jgi:hypothetical protein
MTRLSIGDVEHNSEDVARKVEGDIAFLTERLQLLEQQKNRTPLFCKPIRTCWKAVTLSCIGCVRIPLEPTKLPQAVNEVQVDFVAV